MQTKTIEETLKMPYTIEVKFDQGEHFSGWFARVVEWPGCMTQADSFVELGEMIQDAMRAWIETAIEDGQEIPEPRPAGEFSGKFIVRVPKSLHRELVKIADREGVSLNAFANVALAKAVGAKTQERSVAPRSGNPGLYPADHLRQAPAHQLAEGKSDPKSSH